MITTSGARQSYLPGPGDANSHERGVVPFTVAGGSNNWRALWGTAQAEAHTEARNRRDRVLRYPDLAETLARPPIGYARPDQWTGYVPPATDPEDCPPGSRHGWQCRAHEHYKAANTSGRRRALVALCAEALRREQDDGQEE